MNNGIEQNLSQYYIFNAVAETKNISKATKKLYISQPAISKSITKLEENLGVKLFNRSSRGVSLTEAGELLYEQTYAAFKHLNQAENIIRKNKKLGVGSLKIGVSTTLCKFVLLPFLKQFIQAYPHIKISIACQSSSKTIKLLQNKQVDLGLVGDFSFRDKVIFKPIGSVSDCFVATKEYMKNLKKRHKDDEENIFEDATLILLDRNNLSRRFVDNYIMENEVKTGQMLTGQVLEVSSMDLSIDFAKIGIGIACVIKDFVKKELEEGSLVEIPLRLPIKERQIGFAYLGDSLDNKALLSFINFFNETSTPLPF